MKRIGRWIVAAAALAAGTASAEGNAPATELEPARPALDLDVVLETGAEYDSNIHRVEQREGDDPCRAIRGAPVARAGARFAGGYRRAPGERLAVSGYAGAKVFGDLEGQRENAAVGRVHAAYHKRLGAALAGVRGAYFDTSDFALAQPDPGCDPWLPSRTINLGEAAAEVVVPGPSDYLLRAYAGARAFRYRADRDFDWKGDHYGLELARSLWTGDPDRDARSAHVEMRGGYRLERRNYRGGALTNVCPDGSAADPACFAPAGLPRHDLHHAVTGELVVTGERIYAVRYELELHDSNSYGHSLLRQRLELGVTTELPWRVVATAEGALQLDLYLDSLLLARDVHAQSFVSIDEENRNRLALHLARPVSERLTLEARYALASNELASRELAFRRHTVYGGVVLRLD
jgi:hypothetical protein